MTRFRPLLALLLAALTLMAPAPGAAKKPGADEPITAPAPAVPDLPPEFDVPEIVVGERILSYRSDIAVRADGALDVTETIRVNAEGAEIRHGIYRDFPTVYYRDGRRIRVGFEVAGVTRDGRPERYRVSAFGNGMRITIGDENAFVERGQHSYAIRYTTTRQLGFFQGYDELYWNVTGNGWAFPIDDAEVRIRLPQNVPFGQERAFYTGPQGATAHDATIVSEQPGEIVIRATARLGPREGLTVAVRWQKGIVAEPPPPSAFALWFERFGPPIAAVLALLGLGIFYFYAWKRAGRGPLPGTVVPLFEPPANLGAAAVRYVRRMGFDNRCFAAAIVESGVKGKIRLVEGEKGWLSGAKTVIHKTGEPGDMPPPERGMLTALFAGGDSLEMDKTNHVYFGAARKALQDNLKEAYQGSLFLKNLGWAWVGLVLTLAAMLFVGTVIALSDTYADLGERLLPATGFLLLIGSVLTGINSRFARKDGNWALAGLSALLGLGGSAFMALALVRAVQVEGFPLVLWMMAPLLLLPLVLSAFAWMAAPTREGRQVMDEIAGFERYLSITEEDRLEVLHPPEKTPELFERYLPYAIALGVENRWAGKFAAVLAAAAAEPGGQRGMYWYSGSSDPWSNPGMFATTVGGSLASSVASAATAPGSSSGSGGGGSSGGGGGGGGGGGW
jgi:hypothetical protein